MTAETLAANEIHRPTPSALFTTYGFKWPGVIPYFDQNRDPIWDRGGRQYVRLRLDEPISRTDPETGKVEVRKYHQPYKSKLHIYLPKGFNAHYDDQLVIVEGELKSLSLVEAGIPAVAVSGFYNFLTDGKLLPTLVDLLIDLKPKRVAFFGR